MTRELTLADLAVGQLYACGSRTVGAEEMIAFAREFDPQAFHTEPEAAEGTFFKGLAASGWHTAALTMRIMLDGFRLAGGVIGAGGPIAWPKPVRPGDTLSVDLEVLEIVPSRSRPGQASVQVRITTRDQHGDTVQTFSPRLVVLRAPPPAG